MTKFLEERFDELEQVVRYLHEEKKRTEPAGIEARLQRVEGIVEGLFKLFGNSLVREHEAIKRDRAVLKASKIAGRRHALKRKPLKKQKHRAR